MKDYALGTLFLLLVKPLGCPCCGPEWYRELGRAYARSRHVPLSELPELGHL